MQTPSDLSYAPCQYWVPKFFELFAGLLSIVWRRYSVQTNKTVRFLKLIHSMWLHLCDKKISTQYIESCSFIRERVGELEWCLWYNGNFWTEVLNHGVLEQFYKRGADNTADLYTIKNYIQGDKLSPYYNYICHTHSHNEQKLAKLIANNNKNINKNLQRIYRIVISTKSVYL